MISVAAPARRLSAAWRLRRCDQLARQRLAQPGIERLAQIDVLLADRGNARHERRVPLERSREPGPALLGQLAVGVGMHVVVGQWQVRAHLITFSGDGETSHMRRSFSRARFRRDITVPIGTHCTRAISS